MTSFRVGVARDVRFSSGCNNGGWRDTRRVNGFCTQAPISYSTFVGGVTEVLCKFLTLAMAAQ